MKSLFPLTPAVGPVVLALAHLLASGPAYGASPSAATSPAPVSSPTPAPRPGLVSITRAVGEVGDRIVTSREVRINDAVDQAMSGKPSGTEGFRVSSGQEKSFPAAVSQVLDEWMVYMEAKSLSAQPVARGELSSALKAVEATWGTNPAWRELEASPEEIKDIVERKLIATEFERLKSDPQLAPVSDEDALAYYRKNRLRFGSLPFSSFKDNIKAYLMKQQTDRRLAEWREVLRRKYKVRNFIAG